MASVTYTAKRSISGGRTVGNTYAFTVKWSRFDRKMKRQVNEAVSLNGTKYTTFHRLETYYDCQTAPDNTSSFIAQMREFLDSCAGGETFDIDGTDYTLDGDYSESLVEMSGFYSFTFRVREE